MFYCFVYSPPVVEHVDTSGEAKILRKYEMMFRLRIVSLFTSLEKNAMVMVFFLLTMEVFLGTPLR